MSPVRLVVRGTGELLVTAGALILLFLVWQLFWTDVVAERAQDRTTDAIIEQWAGPAPATPVAPTASGAPEVADPVGVTPAAESNDVLAALPSDVVALMRVPAFGADFVRPVLTGTTDEVLKEGVGQYDGTAGPGEVGNFALAGHRTTYGAPFKAVEVLQIGDPIVIETADSYIVYRVESTEIVLPTDVEVIAPVPDQPGVEPTQAYLTMTTCHPMFSARQRYIVHAVLDTVTPRAAGVPELGA